MDFSLHTKLNTTLLEYLLLLSLLFLGSARFLKTPLRCLSTTNVYLNTIVFSRALIFLFDVFRRSSYLRHSSLVTGASGERIRV
ncbi:hypothetical protein F4821DRAFT_246150, partial [Hypoxylon rubiginosum]